MILVIAVFAFFLILMTGYFRLFVTAKTRKQKFIEKAKQAKSYTEAHYVSDKYYRGDKSSKDDNYYEDTRVVKYAYVVRGKTYYKKLRFQSREMVVSYPTVVTVYYDVKNPKHGVCSEEASPNRSLGCIGWILLVALISFLIIHLF